VLGYESDPRVVRALPIQFWFRPPRRRRHWQRPLLKLAGVAVLAGLVAWLIR